MTEEEKKAIEYLKARLYGNEGCKFIDVAQSDLRIFLNLVERQGKLEKSCLVFTIEGKEVTKEELINYLLEKFKNTGDHIPRID